MNFLEAAEIAKQNPGSRFTRGESGLFVVYLSDGKVITSPDQLLTTTRQTEPNTQSDSNKRLEDLEKLLPSLRRTVEVSNAEIAQLRLEVNSLKAAISKIPSSEWSRFEEQQKRIDEQRKADERARIVSLAKSGQLSHQQLTLVADNATSLGIVGDDLDFIKSEVIRTRPPVPYLGDSLVVYSNTDGQ